VSTSLSLYNHGGPFINFDHSLSRLTTHKRNCAASVWPPQRKQSTLSAESVGWFCGAAVVVGSVDHTPKAIVAVGPERGWTDEEANTMSINVVLKKQH
jgi:16S rRNA U1498 N3-methylase RsmE